jgi:hypothetical protein
LRPRALRKAIVNTAFHKEELSMHLLTRLRLASMLDVSARVATIQLM